MKAQCLGEDSVAFTLFPTTLNEGLSQDVEVLYLQLSLEYDVNT